jgi:hypothetical protein
MFDKKSILSEALGMPRTKPVSNEVKEFLRQMGSKGGKKSAQHPNRRELNTQAAIARWRGKIPTPKAPAK